MKWKLVPVEPTDEMISQAEEMYMPFGEMIAAWDGFIITSPDPTHDDALAVMLADIIWEELSEDTSDPTSTRRAARAVLAVLKGGV